MIKLIKIRFLWVIFFGLFVNNLFAIASPIPMLKQTADTTIDALHQNQATLKTNPQVVYQIIDKILLPHVDIYAMSRSALGRNAWNNATEAQKIAFSREFTNLVIRTYASALANYSNEKIEFLPYRGDFNDQQVVIDSNIVRPDGPAIRLSYSVVQSQGGWKVYDMTVEGVSLLQSFRSQFAEELSRGDLNQLIQKLRQHNGQG